MQVSTHWRTACLVAAALLVGSTIGTPLAQAVSAGLVRIEGGHNAHLAAVSKTGQLSVNAGLATTPAGQVKAAMASPADTVGPLVGAISSGCGLVFTIPAGKALVVTSVNFLNAAVTPGSPHTLFLEAGPTANPCSRFVALSGATQTTETHTQAFDPGIPVPAGDSLWVRGGNDDGDVLVYGYLVPAAAVPHNALQYARPAGLGGLMATKPNQ